MTNDIRNRYRGYDNRSSRPSRSNTGSVRSPAPSTKPDQPPILRTPSNNDMPPPREIQPAPKYIPKQSKKKPIFILVLILMMLCGIGYGGYWYSTRPSDNKQNQAISQSNTSTATPQQNVQQPAQPTAKETIRLIATGDMIAHDSVNQNAKKADGSYDYAALMDDMKPYFSKADIRFCNQATPAGGEQYGITGYPTFNAPIAFARGIESVGCNLINIGTNHTNDKGQSLIDATVASWDDREVLAVTGANRTQAEQDSIEYFEVEGLTFAFVNYMTYNNTTATSYGVNMYTDALAQKQITEAQKNADTVIVSMRWGTEYSPDISAQQDEIAQKLADYGADIILGHGPHVLEPVKKLKSSDGREVIAWYSLGNFLNTQLEAEALIGGFAVMDINTATAKITNVAFMPTYMHYDWTAQDKAANNLSARKNLQMLPLDRAADLLAKSQLGTTVEVQTNRVTSVLNKFTPVKILKSTEF